MDLLKLLQWGERLSSDSGAQLGEDGTMITSAPSAASTNGGIASREGEKTESVTLKLVSCLRQLRHVPREELVTFLQDTLDVLLMLLVKAPQKDQLDNHVFEALVI